MNRALHTSVPPANLRSAVVVLAAPGSAGVTAPAAVTEAWVHRYSNVANSSNDKAAMGNPVPDRSLKTLRRFQ